MTRGRRPESINDFDGTPLKRCGTCHMYKPLADFYPQPKCYLGVKPDCKECYLRRNRASQEKFAPHWRAAVLRRYNLTAEQYDDLVEDQQGRCALCGRAEPGGKGSWHIDHDHSCCPGRTSCGKCVRGLLCNGCNLGAGHLDRMLKATSLEAIAQYFTVPSDDDTRPMEATE